MQKYCAIKERKQNSKEECVDIRVGEIAKVGLPPVTDDGGKDEEAVGGEGIGLQAKRLRSSHSLIVVVVVISKLHVIVIVNFNLDRR